MADGPILNGLRRAAKAAGMIDPEDVRMADISGVRLNADGEVMIPSGFFHALRRAKPMLFGDGPSVRDMSDADYRKVEADYLAKASAKGPGYVAPEGFDARTAPRAEVDRVTREYTSHEMRRELGRLPGRRAG